MGFYKEVEVFEIWNSTGVAAGTTNTADIIDLGDHVQQGFFSLHYKVEGSGTVRLLYKLGNSKERLSYSTTGSTVTADLTSASGFGATGEDHVSFSPTLARYMQLQAYETLGVSGVTVTAHLAVQ